jgi:hypothetical protein
VSTTDFKYVSAIPPEATAKPIDCKDNHNRTTVRYYIGEALVGERVFSESGNLELEYSLRDGKKHGWLYRWDHPGRLLSATPYENGLEHGTAFQWAQDGKLIGSYTMDHGTGIDIWWVEADGEFFVAEARQVQGGLMHGFEYWFTRALPDPLDEEKWWFKGFLHGIERRWNVFGRLQRGYPKYWIHGQRVSKRQYVRACESDASLRPFRQEENQQKRVLPPEIAKLIVTH